MVSTPMVSLASSVHAGPLTFALLVGSGISVDAGVPSGWNLMVDLVRRLAAAHGENPEPDPISWYRQRFDNEPDYSGVLVELAPSPGDRRSLLASYFELRADPRGARGRTETPDPGSPCDRGAGRQRVGEGNSRHELRPAP